MQNGKRCWNCGRLSWTPMEESPWRNHGRFLVNKSYPICSMYGIFTYITGWFLGQMSVNIPYMEHMGTLKQKILHFKKWNTAQKTKKTVSTSAKCVGNMETSVRIEHPWCCECRIKSHLRPPPTTSFKKKQRVFISKTEYPLEIPEKDAQFSSAAPTSVWPGPKVRNPVSNSDWMDSGIPLFMVIISHKIPQNQQPAEPARGLNRLNTSFNIYIFQPTLSSLSGFASETTTTRCRSQSDFKAFEATSSRVTWECLSGSMRILQWNALFVLHVIALSFWESKHMEQKQGKKREKQRVKEQKAKNIKSANWL